MDRNIGGEQVDLTCRSVVVALMRLGIISETVITELSAQLKVPASSLLGILNAASSIESSNNAGAFFGASLGLDVPPAFQVKSARVSFVQFKSGALAIFFGSQQILSVSQADESTVKVVLAATKCLSESLGFKFDHLVVSGDLNDFCLELIDGRRAPVGEGECDQ